MKDDTKEVLRIRVAEVQRRVEGRGRVFRAVWAVAGATVVLIGLVMMLTPGPAIVVLPVGMAMLAAEFGWARRLLNVGIDRGVDFKRSMQATGWRGRLLSTLALLCLVGAVAAVILLRQP